jgi:hypothetical protein
MIRAASRRTALAAALTLPTPPLLPAALRAETAWKPTQGMRIVVPTAPGGTTDIVARLLAAWLQQTWGQSCVVDNKSGAGGIIGSTEVVKASPDGHTLLMGNIGPQSIACSLYRNMPYTPKSLLGVSNTITASNVLVVHPSVPVNSVPELVAWLRAQNGKVSYASSGTVLLRQSHDRHRVRARRQAAGARHHFGGAQSADPRAGAGLRDHARTQAVRRLDLVRHLCAGGHAAAGRRQQGRAAARRQLTVC